MQNQFDAVQKPIHYNSGKIETIDYIQDVTSQITDGFEGACVANVIKYVSRYNKKNGLEDLKKAQWYLNRVIDYKRNPISEKLQPQISKVEPLI